MKKTNYFKEIIDSLRELNKDFGNRDLCEHLALATCEYPKIDFISDKELSFLLKKYIGEQSLGIENQIVNYEEDYDEFSEEDY